METAALGLCIGLSEDIALTSVVGRPRVLRSSS